MNNKKTCPTCHQEIKPIKLKKAPLAPADPRRPPKVGEDIYVDSSFYLSHGVDDKVGGLGRVVEVTYGMSAGEKTPFVEVLEHPGSHYNWEILACMQASLKKEFGKKRAYPAPDNSPESNRWD